MLIIYFLLGLGLTAAHSDYGVSFRAQNFEETLKNIDKETLIQHRREKRFITGTGYYVPQNVTNRPWGSNSSRAFVAKVTRFQNENNASRPYDSVIYPGQPGYIAPSKNTSGVIIFTRTNGTHSGSPQYYVNSGQNSNTTRPGYPVNDPKRPGYNNNFNNTANPSGLKPVTPGYIPYPGYPVQSNVYPVPNNGYPVPNNGYPVPNNGYPVPNSFPVPNNVYPVPNGYPVPNNGYPVPNSFPVPNNGYPVPNNVYPVPNNGYPIPNNSYPVPNSFPVPNNVYPVPNNGYPVPSTVYTTPRNRLPVPNNIYPVTNNSFPVPYNGYPVPNNGYPVPNNSYPVPNNGFPVPNNGYPVPNNGYPVPNNVYPVPNNGYPVPNNSFPVPSFKPPSGFNNTGTGSIDTGNLKNCKCDRVRANSNITKVERTMDACVIACSDCPAGMKMTSFGICVRDESSEDY